MRAVIYCRVSTKEQVEGQSLSVQERSCRAYCERLDADVAEVFVEEGVSAKTADRPQLQKLIDYCHRNRKSIGYVVVYDVSRFARDMVVHTMTKHLLANLGIALRSATQSFDNSPAGMLMENVVAAFSQFDNDQRAQRTREGMLAALRKGQWVHQAQVGYRTGNRSAGEPSLVSDPEMAPLVRSAFEQIATGARTKEDVRAELNARGLRPRHGKPASAETFSRMLRNPIYKGRVRSKKFNFEGPGDFEPIVSSETFAAVQAVLDGRVPHRSERRRDHPEFPLRRFVRCATCARPLTGSRSTGRRRRKYAYYHCPTSCVRFKKTDLERQFLGALDHLSVDEPVLTLFDAVLRDRWADRHATALQRERDLQKQFDEIDDRQGRLIEAHVYQQKIGDDAFQRAQDRLTKEREDVRLQLHRGRPQQLDLDGLLAFARPLLSQPGDFWLRADPTQRPRIQQAIYPNGLRVADELIGTTETSLLFSYLNEVASDESEVASPTGIEPVAKQRKGPKSKA